MRPVLLLDVVGLCSRQLGADTPNLCALAERGAQAPLGAILPAVTCSAQATYLTGKMPAEHGVVGNGWFFRDNGEVRFWNQSNRLVRGEKLYERARARMPGFRCAKLFWWWNMGAAVDYSITPRPYYAADGRKLLSIYTTPPRLKQAVEGSLGKFPFLSFWGPGAGLASTRWIAAATLEVLKAERPTLTLSYLPHLDYDLQRFGPDSKEARTALRAVDEIVGELVAGADEMGAVTVVLSEYGLEKVWQPIPLNRELRRAGLLEVRGGPIGEELDVFASRAFAVVDHQVAHVYTKDERARAQARELLAGTDGVETVLDEDGKQAAGLAHPNAGDLVALARKGAWFSYPYWLDEREAPDFAHTVEIHKKPGYDPCELFLDPSIRFPRLRIARRLAAKFLGLRYLMDVVPLDATLVRGSHGRRPDDPLDGPLFLCSEPWSERNPLPAGGIVPPTSVCERILSILESQP